MAAEAPVISDELAEKDGRLAVLQHTTEIAELEKRTAQAQRETQRAQQQQMTDRLHAERLAHEELRKAGRKFLRETPGYGQRWIDRYGRDPDLIEQVGLFALGRGGALPPSWAEMQQREWLERFRSIGSHQTAGTVAYPRLTPATYVPALPPGPAPLPADGAAGASLPARAWWVIGGSLFVAFAGYIIWATRRWWSPAASLSPD